MTIQILVEEKAELNARVRNLEESEISLKGDLEGAKLAERNLSGAIQNLQSELARAKEAQEQTAANNSIRENDLRTAHQSVSRLKADSNKYRH